MQLLAFVKKTLAKFDTIMYIKENGVQKEDLTRVLEDGTNKSDTILATLQDGQFAAKVVEVDEATISVLVFQLGDYLFAFEGSQAREIFPFTAITWIPGATALLPGVINVRGDVVAVVDMKQALGLRAAGGEMTGGFFVMLRPGDGRTAVLVDGIVDVAAIPVSAKLALLPTLEERFRRFAAWQFAYKESMVTLLDTAVIVDKINGG